MDLSSVKLVISEVDGIITEGLVGFGEINIPIFKQFFIKDFEAINEIKKNWIFVFISSDPHINMSMCKNRNIPFFFAQRNKIEVFRNILNRYSLLPDQVLYIGSSYSDVECMKQAGVSFCTEDSVIPVKKIVDSVLPVVSGMGVLCCVYDLLYEDLLERQRDE